MLDHSVCWFLCLLFVGKCWKKWGFARVNISKYICICAPLLPEGRGAPQSVMGRCSPSSSTSFSHELSGAGAVGRKWGREEMQGNEEGEEWNTLWGSCSLYFSLCNKDDLAGLIALGLLQISSTQQTAGGSCWQCLQVTVIKPQVILILFHL